MSYSENGGTPFNMNVVPAGGAGYGGDFYRWQYSCRNGYGSYSCGCRAAI